MSRRLVAMRERGREAARLVDVTEELLRDAAWPRGVAITRPEDVPEDVLCVAGPNAQGWRLRARWMVEQRLNGRASKPLFVHPNDTARLSTRALVERAFVDTDVDVDALHRAGELKWPTFVWLLMSDGTWQRLYDVMPHLPPPTPQPQPLLLPPQAQAQAQGQAQALDDEDEPPALLMVDLATGAADVEADDADDLVHDPTYVVEPEEEDSPSASGDDDSSSGSESGRRVRRRIDFDVATPARRLPMMSAPAAAAAAAAAAAPAAGPSSAAARRLPVMSAPAAAAAAAAAARATTDSKDRKKDKGKAVMARPPPPARTPGPRCGLCDSEVFYQPASAASASAAGPSTPLTSRSAASVEVPGVLLPCGGVACLGCLAQTAQSLPKLPPNAAAGSGSGGMPTCNFHALLPEAQQPQPHLLPYNETVHAALASDFKTRQTFGQRSVRLLLCPQCDEWASVRPHEAVFYCRQSACFNPPGGYCARCVVPLAIEPVTGQPRACPSCAAERDNKAELEKLLLYATTAAGCMPCPRCKSMYEKFDMCNHVRCWDDACATHYCASCGYNFASHAAHRCNTKSFFKINHDAVRAHYRALYLARCAELNVEPDLARLNGNDNNA